MNTLYQFIEGQTPLGMPRGAWLSMCQNRLLFDQIQALPPRMHHNWKGVIEFIRHTTNGNHRDHSRCKIIVTLIMCRNAIKIHLRAFAATKCLTYLQHDGPRLKGNPRWLMNYQSQETFVHLPLSANDNTVYSGLNGRISA